MYLLSYMDFEQRSHLSIIHYVLCMCQPQKIIFMKSVSLPVAHVLYYNTDHVTMSTIILKFLSFIFSSLYSDYYSLILNIK